MRTGRSETGCEERYMVEKQVIQVAILDDHQAILDGYTYRLNRSEGIVVVASMLYGDELEPTLAETPVDVLILDAQVPTSNDNPSTYPILFLIPRLLQSYSELAILVISMHNQRPLIKAVLEAGSSGFILKNDKAAITDLANIVRQVAKGEIYLSDEALRTISRHTARGSDFGHLSRRQIEVLSLCAAYPDARTDELAAKLRVANSTVRNLLSSTYIKLEVHNRFAAVAKAMQMGLLPPVGSPEWFGSKPGGAQPG